MISNVSFRIPLLAAVAMASLWAAMAAAAADPSDSHYQLVWHDEFNGTTLDERTWNIEVNGDGGGNAELQYYTRQNVSIGRDPQSGASCLVLTARREDYQGRNFTSGRLNTAGKLFFTYGKLESRIKMPRTANGLWPAFWMLGNDYSTVGWPRCGEVDIVEMGNAEGIRRGTQDRFFNGACHWGFYNEQWQYPNYARSTTNAYSLQDDDFHLFTLVWDEEKLSMYLDLDRNPQAAPYYEIGIDGFEDDWSTGHYFNKDFFLVYDLAVGGHFTGILQPNAITALADGAEACMYVDYVRVYQRTDQAAYITLPDGYTDAVRQPCATTPATRRQPAYGLDGRQVPAGTGRSLRLVPTADGYRKVLGR